ncbi:hypothetical protein JYK22_21495, partial [Nonomuraea sp. RK-328]|nr:hypothetical protein [Nonomuraea sp. RK-328]
MTKRTLTLSGERGSYQVALDGHDLSRALRSLTIEVNSRNAGTRVVAELKIDAVEVTSLGARDPQFMLSMPDEAREALIALGWTPPAGDDQ